MDDALAGDGFRQHTNHKPEHGGTAIETLNAFQLFGVDGMGSGILEPLFAGLLVIHGSNANV